MENPDDSTLHSHLKSLIHLQPPNVNFVKTGAECMLCDCVFMFNWTRILFPMSEHQQVQSDLQNNNESAREVICNCSGVFLSAVLTSCCSPCPSLLLIDPQVPSHLGIDCVRNVSDLYLRGPGLESRLGYRLSWQKFPPPSKSRDTGSVLRIRPRPLPSTSFRIHYSSYHSMP
jgi:hypothetical protein